MLPGDDSREEVLRGTPSVAQDRSRSGLRDGRPIELRKKLVLKASGLRGANFVATRELKIASRASAVATAPR